MWVIAQLRRERFIEDLENYGKQVEEFQTCGDMAEIHKYLKKAQILDSKLQSASDKVELRIKLLYFSSSARTAVGLQTSTMF